MLSRNSRIGSFYNLVDSGHLAVDSGYQNAEVIRTATRKSNSCKGGNFTSKEGNLIGTSANDRVMPVRSVQHIQCQLHVVRWVAVMLQSLQCTVVQHSSNGNLWTRLGCYIIYVLKEKDVYHYYYLYRKTAKICNANMYNLHLALAHKPKALALWTISLDKYSILRNLLSWKYIIDWSEARKINDQSLTGKIQCVGYKTKLWGKR